MVRILCAALGVLLLPLSAAAQDGGVRTTPASPGVNRCARANWVCVSECIDVRCIEKCLERGCDQRLRELRECTQAKRCHGEDKDCAKEQCGPICTAAFDHAKERLTERIEDPCAGMPPVNVPPELVGGWNLQAASIASFESSSTAPTPEPRPDYEKVLTVNDRGCFILETKLEDTTLGQGNLLVVRSWGTLAVTPGKKKSERQLRFETQGGQAVGHTCSNPRAIDLKAEKFVRPQYGLELREDVLTLTSTQADGQTFQFKKGAPQQLDEEK